MSDFASILNASISDRKPRFQPGNYLARPTKLTFADTRSGKMFIGEFLIEEFTATEGTPENAFVQGSAAATVIKMSLDTAAKNIKSLVLGLFRAQAENEGENPNDVRESDMTEEWLRKAIGPESVFVSAGTLCSIQAYNQPTKAGGTYTHLLFGPPSAVRR